MNKYFQELFYQANAGQYVRKCKQRRLQEKIAQEANQQFLEACEILLSAYVDKNGAGAMATGLDGHERKGWVIPIAETDENSRKLEELKRSDRFQQRVRLYKKASPIPPHQAMVVQMLKGTEFKVVYRIRDDIKMGL